MGNLGAEIANEWQTGEQANNEHEQAAFAPSRQRPQGRLHVRPFYDRAECGLPHRAGEDARSGEAKNFKITQLVEFPEGQSRLWPCPDMVCLFSSPPLRLN